jgi:hypothetical protein
MRSRDDAVSEVAAELLIVGLVLILGVIIMVMVFGIMPSIPKTAYVSLDSSYKNMSGYSAVALYHRGGDALNFSASQISSFPAEIYVDTPAGSFRAVPDSSAALFRPGDVVYIYNSSAGYRVTKSLTGVVATQLPLANTRIRVIDSTAHLLIYSWPSGTAPVTKTATTTTPVTTATTSPGNIIRVAWTPSGLGYGSISIPTALANPASVPFTPGSSLTFSFVPLAQANKAVLSITLDGAVVYSGSAKNKTINYTLTNITQYHMLNATFG